MGREPDAGGAAPASPADGAGAERRRRAKEALAAAERAVSAHGSSRETSSESTGPARRPRGGRRPRGPADPPPTVAGDTEPDPTDVARQIVLRQLALGPRTRAQLRDKLLARQCSEDVADAVLDRMTEVGLVDDGAYARMLVHSRQETKGLARRALAQELARKGVDRDVADEALGGIEPAEEEERARELVTKRLGRLHGLDAQVQTRRLAGMLARKGYSPSLAYRVVREAVEALPEHRRD